MMNVKYQDLCNMKRHAVEAWMEMRVHFFNIPKNPKGNFNFFFPNVIQSLNIDTNIIL